MMMMMLMLMMMMRMRMMMILTCPQMHLSMGAPEDPAAGTGQRVGEHPHFVQAECKATTNTPRVHHHRMMLMLMS
eukprot:8471724-Karenia_brevis.AAC.1